MLNNLKIRWKFVLSSLIVMSVSVCIITLLVVQNLKQNVREETGKIRLAEMSKVKANLKNYVDIAYETIDSNIKAASDIKYLEKRYGHSLKNIVDIASKIIDDTRIDVQRGELTIEEAQEKAADTIRQLRYNGGKGYIWINDMGMPYARMIMHPTVPALNGKVLDSPKYNCALGEKKNLFTAFVDVCRQNGEGFVDYLWPKPTKDGLTAEQPKLSYVREYESLGWVIGTGKYIDDIDAVVAEKTLEANSQINALFLKIIGICLSVSLLAIFPFLFLSKKITGPIIDCADFAKELGEGNLTSEVNVVAADEVGSLGRELNKMARKLRTILSQVSQNSAVVLSSAHHLSTTSSQMTKASEAVSEQTGIVAVATEQISANIGTISRTADSVTDTADEIAATSREVTTDINSVAAAVEEMSASTREVAKNCADAQQNAALAMDKTNDSSGRITELNQAAKNIGQVIDVITEITEQTKLLALNATIEAARAGEAGKGFAVVANEVKDLARQTADATEKIISQIQNMQSKTESVVKDIDEIATINKDVHEINSTIAVAVKEQSATTDEIARTVAGTAQGVEQVAKKMQDLSSSINQELAVAIREAFSGAEEISVNIQEVNSVIQEGATSSAGNYAFASELETVAIELGNNVEQFKLGDERFDIGKVKAAHLAWRSKLQGLLQHGASLTSDHLVDHQDCEFGKWLAGDKGQALAVHAAFQNVEMSHRNVHDLALQIVEIHQEGREKEARKLMIAFEESRNLLFASLDELYFNS